MNYLFGPFIGEAIYELNYFVGHAIYLRKKNPRKNKIIVCTRKEHFDFYGKYATTFIPLRLSDNFIPYKFDCKNISLKFYDELTRRFELKYRSRMMIHGHLYPQISTQLKNIKWYYRRDKVNFNFRPRSLNKIIAFDIIGEEKDLILSDLSDHCIETEGHFVIPTSYLYQSLEINRDESSVYGIMIEIIKQCKYVYADIDSVAGRLAMLTRTPLITERKFLDVQYINPINPYSSIVIGCETLEDGIKYMEENYANNI